MEYYNKINDFSEDARRCMAEKGLPFEGDMIIDGEFHRYSADENKRKQDEWYVAHEGTSSRGNSYLNVAFGSWSEGSRYTYNSFEKNNSIDYEERLELIEEADLNRIKIEDEIKRKYNNAEKHAQTLWNSYSTLSPTEEYLRYVKQKGIKVCSDVKYGLNPAGYPSMVIPLTKSQGKLRSLQYISCDNENKSYKTFLKGGEKRGNSHIIGTITQATERIFFVEGYATGASVFEALNEPTIICFDAGNIETVVESFKKKYQDLLFIVAADNDKAGMGAAENAENKFGCKVVLPQFPPEMKNESYTDFNDLHKICGLDEVRKQLIQKKIVHTSETPAKAQDRIADSYLTGNHEPCETFKLNNLPPILKDYVSFLCKDTNAHPIMVTSSVLTMVSAYVGTKVCIREGHYFQDLYPNLWILCIAKSGQFKTTALNKGAKIAYEHQTKIFKSIKELKKNASEEKIDINEQILKKSRENVVLPTKTTAEGFLEYLSEGHQGAVYASEFGGWLQNLDKNHNNDFKAILTEFYDVPSYYRYKTKTQGDCIIQKPFMSICGVSTMPWISANIKPMDIPSGFFARFLIFTPPYQDDIPPALPSDIINSSKKDEQIFKDYLGLALSQIGENREYSLTEKARNLFTSYHAAIYEESKLRGEHAQEILQPYLKRWSPYLLKLAILMQVFIDVNSDLIDESAILMAYSILFPAMKSTALLLEKELGESDHQRKCRILFEWICRKKSLGKIVKRHAIMSSKKLAGGSKEYDYVLQTLIDQGKIEYIEYPKKNDSEYLLVEEIETN